MYKALDIAKYILSFQKEIPLCLTHLKLQKLLYYAQAYHLAFLDKALFEDKIEAWDYGPVVPAVYREYKEYGMDVLPIPEGHFTLSNTDSISVISEVLDVLGQKTAIALVSMTHREAPWADAYIPGKNNEISLESMKSFYKKLVAENNAGKMNF